MVAANPSRIEYWDQRLHAGWRDECHVNINHTSGLIEGAVHLFFCFKEHRTGRVNRNAAVAVLLRESTALHHHNDGSWMIVPSGIAARLKYQLSLQYIAWPLHMQIDVLLGTVALGERNDLQRVH